MNGDAVNRDRGVCQPVALGKKDSLEGADTTLCSERCHGADHVPAGGTLLARSALDRLAAAVAACGCSG